MICQNYPLVSFFRLLLTAVSIIRAHSLKISHFDGELARLKDAIAREIAWMDATYAAKLAGLIKIYAEALKSVQRKSGKLTFGDVTAAVHSLLNPSTEALQDNRELLYFRLDSKITHILIDEFQDTDICQYEIMLPLISEALAGKGAEERCGSFFYVGDKKQSIYKFRGAERKILIFCASSLVKSKRRACRAIIAV